MSAGSTEDPNRRLRWLELTADYTCNNRCLGCPSALDDGPTMSSHEIVRALIAARGRGADSLWLGGGEPTLRKDLFAIVKRARELGFSRIKLQTNGMLLAYPEFADRCAAAGISEVSFSIKGACTETHDRLTRTPGCHALLARAIAEVRRLGLPMEGDFLVYRQNLDEIVSALKSYYAQGLARMNLWLLWAPLEDPELAAEVPRISELAARIAEARRTLPELPADFVRSLHTPPCTLLPAHRDVSFFAPALDLWVQNPGEHGFFLETSPIEGGHYLAGCAKCRERQRCGGIRTDYLALHGESEFSPVT